MKKKYLNSLGMMEKWLAANNTMNSEIQNAVELLKEAIKRTSEDKETTPDVLPAPGELIESPRSIALFADGACRGNPGPGAYGFVIQNAQGMVLAEGSEFETITTNNKMELQGVLHGLRELKAILPHHQMDPLLASVKVMTDSKYVVDGMKSWVAGWKARGWKKADHKPPENLELWQALDEARTHFFEVEWLWVKGHAGHIQNEYCDRKANEAIDDNT